MKKQWPMAKPGSENAGVNAMTTGYKSIDIVLDHVDKCVALVELAKKLGSEMDQVIVFGDNLTTCI